MVSEDFVVRVNIFIFVVVVVLLILLELFSNKFPESFNVFITWFASVMITILSYLILKWFKSENIELFRTICVLFVLQSIIYVVSTVAIRQVVDLNKEVTQGIFRLFIVGIFAILWVSFIPLIWRNELKYVILTPVSISFFVFMLTDFLKILKQDIPQNDYSTQIINSLNRYNSTPLQLITNLHIWCSIVYLCYEMIV